MNRQDIPLALFFSLAFLGLGLLVWWLVATSNERQRKWEVFVVEHNCKIVERREARINTSFGTAANGKSGLITTTIPEEVAWRCDDGITYWR